MTPWFDPVKHTRPCLAYRVLARGPLPWLAALLPLASALT